MGDYVGSAAANTFLFGMFTVLNGGEVIGINNFIITFLFIAAALLLFYFLSHKEGVVSRNTGLLLIGIYIVFVLVELM